MRISFAFETSLGNCYKAMESWCPTNGCDVTIKFIPNRGPEQQKKAKSRAGETSTIAFQDDTVFHESIIYYSKCRCINGGKREFKF